MNSNYDFFNLETFKIVATFSLGLISVLLADWIKTRKRKKILKKFIYNYLVNTILLELPKMNNSYTVIKRRVENPTIINIDKISAHELFNCFVFDAVKPDEYFTVFKTKYFELNKIIAIIKFMSINMPITVYKQHFDFINQHLKDIDKIGDIEHVYTCNTCIDKKNVTLGTIECLKEDINELEILINNFMKKR